MSGRQHEEGKHMRTPILQIGAEFYCDTLLILHVIEKLGGSGALYPKGQEGLAKAFGWWLMGWPGRAQRLICWACGWRRYARAQGACDAHISEDTGNHHHDRD
jgi:hypothetical protein